MFFLFKAPESVRRSSRKRTANKAYDFETPLNPTRGRANNRILATPMITPKFDIATPMAKTIYREAKPTETLISMSGSPVCPTIASAAAKSKVKKAMKNHFAVPLDNGKTMMVPLDQPGQHDLDLDDDARQKILSMRSALDSLLAQNKKD